MARPLTRCVRIRNGKLRQEHRGVCVCQRQKVPTEAGEIFPRHLLTKPETALGLQRGAAYTARVPRRVSGSPDPVHPQACCRLRAAPRPVPRLCLCHCGCETPIHPLFEAELASLPKLPGCAHFIALARVFSISFVLWVSYSWKHRIIQKATRLPDRFTRNTCPKLTSTPSGPIPLLVIVLVTF